MTNPNNGDSFEIAGWKLKDSDDGQYVLSHPEYGGSVLFPPHEKINSGILETIAWYFVRDLLAELKAND